MTADLKGLQTKLKRAQKTVKNFTARINRFMERNAANMRRLGTQIALVGAAIATAFGVAVKAFADFDRAMRQATAATSVTEEGFESLSNLVEKMSVDLNVVATEAAQGIKFLGFAGLTAAQQMKAFPPLLKLAKAGMADMGLVTEKTLGIMGAYQIEFDKTAEVTDFLAKLWGSSQQTLEQLSEAMGFSAATAKKAKVSLEELGAMTAFLAKAGIKGSRAGTTLRRSIIALTAPTGQAASILRELGVEIADQEGNLRPYLDVLEEVIAALENVGEAEQAMAFKVLFGLRAIEGQTVIAGRGIDELRKYVKVLEDAAGTTDKMVKKQLMAFAEQMGIIRRQVGALARDLGETLVPMITAFGKKLKESMVSMQQWIKQNKALTAAFTTTAVSLAALMVVVGSALIVLGSLALTANALGITFTVLLTKIVLLTAGLAALTGVFALVITNSKEMEKSYKRSIKLIEASTEILEEAKTKWEEFNAAIEEGTRMGDLVDDYKKVTIRIKTLTNQLVNLEDEIGKLDPFAKHFGRRHLESMRFRIETELKQAKIQLALLEDVLGRQVKAQEVAVVEEEKIAQRQLSFMELWTEAMNERAEDAVSAAEAIKESMKDAADSMEEAFAEAFTSIANGTKGFKQTMIDLFTDIAQSINEMMSKILARHLTQQITQSAAAGGFFGMFGGLVPAAKGGVMPGGFRAFRNGGIVRKPTLGLVGEGGQDEAVVPLPDGRSIPVEMQGGGKTEVHFHISAIDGPGTMQFFRSNQRVISDIVKGSLKDNHPLRRGSRGLG